jgi:hypothetical protein
MMKYRLLAILLTPFLDPEFFPGWGSALLFDEAYRPKPAYHALVEALSGR